MRTGYDQFFKKASRVKPEERKVRAATAPKAAASAKSTQDLALQIQKAMKSAAAKKNQSRKKKANPLLFVSLSGFIICLLGLVFYDEAENAVKRVEIGLFGSAVANESPAAPTAAESGQSDKSKDEKAEAKATSSEVLAPTADQDHLGKLQDRKKELDQREEELNRVEAELAAQRVEIEKKIKNLEEMREQISGILKERVKSDSSKVETLVQVYSSMKPTQAAKIFETMDEDLAIEILGRMKKKVAADIMNLIKPEKAQLFSEKFAGYRMPASK